jgi:SAM-dependent methyltransferase
MLPEPSDDYLADPKLRKIFSASLGELERAYDEEKASGTLDPDLAQVYEPLLEARSAEVLEELSTLEPAEIVRRVEQDVIDGRITRGFADAAVVPLWAEKERQRQARSLKEAAGGVVQSIRDTGDGSLVRGVARTGAEAVKTIARGVKETAKGIGESVVGTAATFTADTEEEAKTAAEVALKGQLKVASGLEGGGRQTLATLARFGQAIIPGDSQAEQNVVGVLNRAFGGAVPRTAEVARKLEAGDDASAWRIATQDALGQIENSRAEGSLAKKLGVNAAELENLGIEVNASDLKSIEDSAEAMSELVEAVATAGVSLAFTPVKAGVKATLRLPGGRRVANLAEKVSQAGVKLTGTVQPGTLSRTAETVAQETERVVKQAERYNTALKKARVAAGNASIEFGTFLRQQAAAGLPRGSGVLAASGAWMAGADFQEGVMAGVAGSLGSRLLTNRYTRAAAGSALQGAGRFVQRDFLPLPLENFRRGLVDFSADYKPLRAAFVGAGAGVVGSVPFIIGAETDAEAASSLVSGATFGSGAALGQRVKAWGSDSLTKRAAALRGDAAEMQGPVQPSAASGLDAEADAINLRSEQELSQSGLRFVQQLRAFAKSAANADFFVGQTPEDMAALFQKFHKNPGAAADFNGVFIDAKDSTTGKPVVLTKIGTSAGGHEVTHAIMAAAEADPTTKPLVDAARQSAARALGAEYDVKTGKIKYTSPELDAIREHYMSLDPAGRQISWEYALDEVIAEHGSVQMSGAPAGKVGGSKTISKALGDVFVKFADVALGRKVGLTDSAVATSEVLPYSPSFDLMDRVGEVIRARALEQSADIPDASFESTAQPRQGDPTAPIPVPAGNVQAAPVVVAPPQRPSSTVDVGVATPVPRDLITPPPARVTTTPGADVGTLNPVPEALLRDPSMAPVTPPQQRVVAEEAGEATPDVAPETAAVAPETAAVAPQPIVPAGAVRGEQVQAARTNFESPLTDSEKRMIAAVQPDDNLRPVAEKLISHVKALGGQRVGIPVMEMSYKDDTTGVVRSKRVAPYGYEVSSRGKVTVNAADLDRLSYNAGLIFDWAATKGRALPYTGLDDPAFYQDAQTYWLNQAEGRRGSGEPLFSDGGLSKASGEPKAKLTRDKEMFLSMVMGLGPATSVAAMGRVNATARASGITPARTMDGLEPNSLRDQLRREGAPLETIYQGDPDPTRVQSNRQNRNSVVMQLRLPNVQSFSVTGQTISQPNIRAIEASFMPAGATEKAKFDEFKNFFSNVTKGQFGKSDRPFVPELSERLNTPELRRTVEVRQSHAGNFDDHIQKSIPTFYEAQIGTATALAKSLPEGAVVLDIAASEGSYGKTITELSDGGVRTVSLDPNLDMAKFFSEKSDVPGASYSTEAFGASFEDDGRKVEQHDPAEKYDAIHESMGFQFISPDRDGQIAEVKRLLKPDGVFVTEQKLKNPEWAANEKLKDTQHKNKYFSTEELAAKDRVVGFSSEKKTDAAVTQSASETKAVGMVANQVEQQALEDVLKKNFKHVVQYWDAGNFKGYAASDSKAVVDAFVAELPDLNSKFSNVQTPRTVAAFMPAKAEDLGTIEQQTARAEEALSLAVPKAEGAQFMPAKTATLANEKAKGKDVQFKRKAKKGAKGGIVDLVHFSSQNLKEIDPNKSFGKGAATAADRMGQNKAYFYVKGTAYEGPIATRPNVYEAQVDGNSLYDYNEDALGVRSIVNRELRDQAIRDAGFVGYFVETEGFDAVAIFEPIKVRASLRQEVMTRGQMKALGLNRQEPGDLAEEARQERVQALRRTPAYKRAEARIAERVGSRTNGAFFDAMESWVEKRLNATPEAKAARFVGLTTSTPRFQPTGELAGQTVRKARARDPLGLFPQAQRTLDAIPEKATRQQIEAAFRDGVKEKGQIKERPVRKEELEDIKTPDGTSLAQFLKDNPTAGLPEIKAFVRDASTTLDRVVLQGPGQRWEFDGETFETEREAERARERALEVAYSDAYEREVEYLSASVTPSEDAVTVEDGDREIFTVRKVPETELTDEERADGNAVVEILDEDGDVETRLYEDEAPRELRRLAERYNSRLDPEVYAYGDNVPSIEEVGSEGDGVNYENYTLRGTDSDGYKEVLFTVEGGAYPGYTSSHFQDATDNYLAHARVDDGHRTQDGKSVYLVEEIQSDRHQAARDEGYDITPPGPTPERFRELSAALDANYEAQAAVMRVLETVNTPDDPGATTRELLARQRDYDEAVQQERRLREERTAIRAEMTPASLGSVPDAPFKKSWKEMVFKSLLTEAVQDGKDVFAWTPGDKQAARYSNALQKAVDTVETKKNPDGTYDASFYKNTRVVSEEKGVTPTRLSDLVGKAAATKIVQEADAAEGEFATIDGANLSVGGEGMRAVYDRVLVNFANDFLKKYGVKVSELQLNLPRADTRVNVNPKVWGFEIPAKLREDVAAEGLPRYMPNAVRRGDLSRARVPRRQAGALARVRITDEQPEE